MIIVKAKIQTLEVNEQTFFVETRESLVTLLQMLERYQNCLSYGVFNTVSFEQIIDLKTNFNISNQSFTKLQS